MNRRDGPWIGTVGILYLFINATPLVIGPIALGAILGGIISDPRVK